MIFFKQQCSFFPLKYMHLRYVTFIIFYLTFCLVFSKSVTVFLSSHIKRGYSRCNQIVFSILEDCKYWPIIPLLFWGLKKKNRYVGVSRGSWQGSIEESVNMFIIPLHKPVRAHYKAQHKIIYSPCSAMTQIPGLQWHFQWKKCWRTWV